MHWLWGAFDRNIFFGMTTLAVLGEVTSPDKVLQEGCQLIKKDSKALMKTIKFTGITINLGFIGLNFAGGFSKENISI